MASPESEQPSSALPSPAKENLETLSEFQEGEEAKISGLQLAIERISRMIGSPAFFALAVTFIAAWMAVNEWGEHHGWRHVDTPPFMWLQALVSSSCCC